MAQTTRERFFDEFADSDSRFPHLIYSSTDRSADLPHSRSLITVVYSLEWPSDKGVPIPYRKVADNDQANAALGNIFRTIDFFERHLAVPVSLFDVRSGCVRVRYSYDTSVDEYRLSNGVARFKDALSAYDATYISATYHGRSVRISD